MEVLTEIKPAETERSPDWTIDELYRKSWQIVKNNRILWIFAAAIGGGFSLNSSYNFGPQDISGLQKLFENKSLPETDKINVLGVATNSFLDTLAYIFSAVPFWFYLLFAVELIFLIIMGVFISIVYKAWANGALLANIEICINGGKASIREGSEKAFSLIRSLIILRLIPWVFSVVASLLGLLVVLILIIASGMNLFASSFPTLNGTQTIFFVIFITTLAIAAIISYIMLTLVLIWAPRIVVMEKKSVRQALVSGFKIARKKLGSMLLLGLVNSILTAFIFFLPLAVVVGIIIAGILIGIKNEQLIVILIIFGSLFVLTLIVAFTLGTAILNAFKATVWSLAYTKIKEKYA